MPRMRIFRSALNDVKYAAGRPLTVREYFELPEREQNRLHQMKANNKE